MNTFMHYWSVYLTGMLLCYALAIVFQVHRGCQAMLAAKRAAQKLFSTDFDMTKDQFNASDLANKGRHIARGAAPVIVFGLLGHVFAVLLLIVVIVNAIIYIKHS